MDPSAVEALAARVESLAGGSLRRSARLAPMTSYRIGGPADVLFEPATVGGLAAALSAATELDVPVTLIGGGTNLLVADAGVRGLVVRLGRAFDRTRWEVRPRGEATLEVGAAASLIRTARDAVARGYSGLEFAAGIPGSVGGGARMNAGAFGGELSNAVESLTGVRRDGAVLTWPRETLDFRYRKLALDPAVVITSVRFRLRRSSVRRLEADVRRVQAKRKRNQPAGFPNAGSVFKNPHGEFAGRLIERAGMKGRQVGGARVSDEHANFIVNTGQAKAEDVWSLMRIVQQEVWEKSGVWLEPEVRLVGDWPCRD